MTTMTYQERRGELETYFDRTAADAWRRLTSDEAVGRIRATVRAGRDRMRERLLAWLPADLEGRTILDAGCGTGALAVEAARRGAHVTAIDLSPTLIQLARERLPTELGAGRIDFRVGDMFDERLGRFDHVVAMDSLIHYDAADIVRVLSAFGRLAGASVLFTFAPRTPALAAMHAVGRLIPNRQHRAPAIVPVGRDALQRRIAAAPELTGWRVSRDERIASGFYTSHAQELIRG
ncbi:MAG: magnesium protoporphyrin IX methyltransferase [Gammaproteobacteria bacterium]|jgi:magnesium-protoporphyrin O-methyltransferase|nr:magnesium protoporphyrin IX methyltransferase [Gammaproteobacteria bacterium]